MKSFLRTKQVISGKLGSIFMILLGTTFGTQVLAFTAPTTTNNETVGLLADAYDIIVTKILLGPVGFTVGIGIVIFGVFSVIKGSWMQGIVSIVSAAILIKAPAIITTFGVVVYLI